MKFFTPLVLFAAVASATSAGNGLTSQQVEKITKNTDKLVKQLSKTCPDLPSKCVAPLKALIGDLGDAASHDDINAIQQSALNFVEGLKSTPECLGTTIQCVASIQKIME